MTVMEGRTTAGDAQALNRRLRNLAMLEEAERRGLTVAQEEVNYELNGQRQLYADEEGVREMLDDYCENAGITIEQHFSMQEELMPHYILRQKSCAMRSDRSIVRSIGCNSPGSIHRRKCWTT